MERRPGAKMSLAELASHTHHGVDNTGNVRVWPAEQVLLHVVLQALQKRHSQRKPSTMTTTRAMQSPPAVLSQMILPTALCQGPRGLRGCRVLELGGGMTALAGLAIAAVTDASCVVVTDGNPESVKKQAQNIRLNAPLFSRTELLSSTVTASAVVLAHRLFWEHNDESGTESAMLGSLAIADAGADKSGQCFDLILGADLLFFESHGALVSSLNRLLSVANPDAAVLLCQPSRKGTMETFLRHPEVAAHFKADLFPCDVGYNVSKIERSRENGFVGGASSQGNVSGGGSVPEVASHCYDQAVREMHRSYLGDPNYTPTIHCPHLIRLMRR
jgi:predicted nicotinamide N-methyase